MNTDIFFDAFTGVPLTYLLKMAKGKRAKAIEERSQNLRLRTANHRISRRICAQFKRHTELFAIHRIEQEIDRERLWELIRSGEFKPSDNPCYRRMIIDPETGEDLPTIPQPQPEEPEPRRQIRIPTILKRSHAKKMALAKRKKEELEQADVIITVTPVTDSEESAKNN
ncbi:unnamed protein product [Caenorhabditis brenneri]